MTCNNRHVPLLACLLAGAAFASCRGAAIHEAMPDGGGAGAGGGAGNGTGGTARGGGGGAGTSGPAGAAGPGGSGGSASGTGGRGGSAGGGRGGAAGGGAIGGVGCAAQMQPTLFWEGQSSPVSSDGTSTRYYWVEFDPPNFTVRYLLGAPPANEYKHPFQVEASVAGMFNVAISETRVAATWNDVGEVAVYGADYDSVQIGQTLTLDNRSAVTLAGTMVYYSHNPAGGNPTPGIYQWQPPAAATLFESFSQLASDATFGQLLRTTQSKLLLSDHTDVRMVTISPTKTAAGLLFVNFFGHPVMDVRPARPHDHDGGVIVQLQDDALFGRDYYTDVTAPENPPTDLGAATSALADASACGAAAHYHGPGVLFGQRYIYEGQAGLFAVDVSTAGAVSNLIRLTDLPLLRPEVTGAGDLFAVAATPSSSLYYYYRVGKL